MFFNDEKALIVFFLSYYFGVHQVIVSFKKDKTFCGVFCERATPGGYLKFLHFFIFLIFQKIVSESNCI